MSEIEDNLGKDDHWKIQVFTGIPSMVEVALAGWYEQHVSLGEWSHLKGYRVCLDSKGSPVISVSTSPPNDRGYVACVVTALVNKLPEFMQ